MKFAASAFIAAAAVVLASPASAQFAKPEDAIKYRQGALFVMGQHFGRIGAMVNGRAPYDAKAAVENAEIVAEMARAAMGGFRQPAPTRGRPRGPSRKSGPNRPSSRSTTRSWWPRPANCSSPPGPTAWTP